MDVLTAIKTRRSIRSFKRKSIEEEILRKILEAATYAPSSGNLQNWEFVIVRDPERKRKIAEIAYGQEFVADADVVIVACSDQNRVARYGERGKKLYAIQNVAAAVQNLMLAAWSFGIGSCWVGAFDEAELSELLNLPEHVVPHAIIALGYPDERPSVPPRRKLEEVIHKEKW